MNATAINKLKRGEQPTEAELRAAGYCLECAGYGWFPAEDGVTEIGCMNCLGTGEGAPDPQPKGICPKCGSDWCSDAGCGTP
jgi:hypothetical protein